MEFNNTATSIRHQLLTGEVLTYEIGLKSISVFVDRIKRLTQSANWNADFVEKLVNSGANPLVNVTNKHGRAVDFNEEAYQNARLHLADLIERKKTGEIELLPEVESPSPGFRSPLVIRYGTVADHNMRVKWAKPNPAIRGSSTPKSIGKISRIEGEYFETQVPQGWNRVAIRTARKRDNNVRLFILAHRRDGEGTGIDTFRFHQFSAEGHYDIVHHVNNAKAATAEFREFVPE